MANMIMVYDGRLGSDASVKLIGNGNKLIEFSVADSQYDYSKKEKTTLWLKVKIFRKADDKKLEYLEKRLKKGAQVSVFGMLKEEKWTDKDGNERTSMIVEVGYDDRMPTVYGSDGAQSQSSNPASASSPVQASEAPSGSGDDDDDLPF